MAKTKPQRRIVAQWMARLGEKPMLKRLLLTKRQLLSLLRNEAFLARVQTLLPIRERQSCAALLGVCRPLLEELAPEPPQGWAGYCYRYAVGLMFPEKAQWAGVARENTAAEQDAALLFLSFLQVMFEEERRALPFDPLMDFAFPSQAELDAGDRGAEFARFLYCWRDEFIYEAMRLGREVTPFHTLEHIAGVHHVAMTVARGLAAAGKPIDLGLISAAAAGHDLGKFGCKPDERVPYLHYYYTDCWFIARQMAAIGHIAANHSTWDLELENLSAESLSLIYADFRVKQSRARDGRELTHIYSLAESFDVILQKLDDVDEKKQRRYRFVYAKLQDFEGYLRRFGVDVALTGKPCPAPAAPDVALMDAQQTLDALTHMTVEHNLALMNLLGHERRFGNILEAARSEKNWKRIRAYISIFEEYFTYLGAGQKVQALGFLYELLMHREGDIRRQAAALIGNIIARFNMGYHKELPHGAAPLPGMQTPFALWEQYLDKIIRPDHKLTPQHKSYIGYTLKIVVDSVLEHCPSADARRYLEALLRYYQNPEGLEESAAFSLLDTLFYLPLALCSVAERTQMHHFAAYFIGHGHTTHAVAALRFFQRLAETLPADDPCCRLIADFIPGFDCKGDITLTFLQCKILKALGLPCAAQCAALYERDVVSDIFLDNLKSATSWICKSVNIALLVDQIEQGIYNHILHISAHLSNLIKVSERVVVRHGAGRALLQIAPLLSLDQRNEIVVELTKGLEVGEYEFSKYIPEYLGELALFLHPQELYELLGRLRQLLGSPNDRIVSVALNTVGVLLECYPAYRGRFAETDEAFENRRRMLLGMLLSGLASYRDTVRQEALLVLGKQVFGSPRLAHEEKAAIFSLCFKKMLFLMHENAGGELTFFYRAAALSHIYRFMALQRLDYGAFAFEARDRVAFFPGTFDPFTLSHKGIVRAIRDMGFEVYLAVDEFSWSKKTQPHLIRRRIVGMSVAGEFHVHLFPDDIPVNIANPADLRRLRQVFAGRELYIAVGSDVVEHASSYLMPPGEDTIHSMNHLVFRRVSGLEEPHSDGELQNLSRIAGKVIELQLPTHLEDISSTRIRENIDLNRDVTNLIDPLVQDFIYHNSLYLREPQYKPTLRPRDIAFDWQQAPNGRLMAELSQLLTIAHGAAEADAVCRAVLRGGDSLLIMRHRTDDNTPLGFLSYRLIDGSALLSVLRRVSLADAVRQRAAGQILLITGIYHRKNDATYDFCQLLLTEVLTHALAQGSGYAICRHPLAGFAPPVIETLLRQGFCKVPECDEAHPLLAVDMRAPLVLMQNLETTIKEPLSSNERVLAAIRAAHRRLQQAMTALYPGQLVLSLNSGIIHHRLVMKITALNSVPLTPTVPRRLGALMCVPFGKILRGRVVPNTVTKTLHTDKVYEPDLSRSTIEAFPYYTALQSQLRAIRSFNRPVILVDDLLHDGDRWQALEPLIRQEGVDVRTVLVGLLSGRGRDLMQERHRPVDSVYYLPNLRHWFVESTLYPFIGGDTVRRDRQPVAGLLPSVNMILPYAASRLPQGCSRQAVFDFSCCCIENARDILLVLEAEYREQFARNLTLSRLSEAVILPLCPDKGGCLSYDPNLAASVYLENDLEQLRRTRAQLI